LYQQDSSVKASAVKLADYKQTDSVELIGTQQVVSFFPVGLFTQMVSQKRKGMQGI
jgi:hypothetical protein